jgi:hypothetical protein
MATSNLEQLLAGEAALNDALAELSNVSTLSLADRRALRDDLEAARSALRRCRRLGAFLTDFVTLSLGAQRRAIGYDPTRVAAVDASAGSWRA